MACAQYGAGHRVIHTEYTGLPHFRSTLRSGNPIVDAHIEDDPDIADPATLQTQRHPALLFAPAALTSHITLSHHPFHPLSWTSLSQLPSRGLIPHIRW